MADHELVDITIGFLRDNWGYGASPYGYGSYGSVPQPVIIDRDDAESQDFLGRKVQWDLADDNAISVSASPDRVTEPMGTGYNYKVEDGVNIRIEAAHEDHWGHVADADEFEALVGTAEAAILVEREFPYPNPDGKAHYHTLVTRNATNRSSDEKDYFRYDFDVFFRGYEELP